MYRNYIMLVVSFCLLNACSSPTVVNQKTIGGNDKDEPQSMCLTKDGGFIVAGSSFSQKSGDKLTDNYGYIYSDYWIIKFNAVGEIQWQKMIGGDNTDFARCITVTSDGGYIIAGESESDSSADKSENSRGGPDIWVVKIDSIGNVMWDKTLGGSGAEVCTAIRQTKNGGYIIGGASNSNISGEKTENCRGDFDFWVVKLDTKGNVEWDKTLGGNKFEYCGGMELTDNDNVVLCGNSASDSSTEKPEKNRGTVADAWAVKLDMKGNLLWQKVFGGKNDEMFLGISKTNDSGLIITAFSNSNKGFEKSEDSKGGMDIWVIKTDKNGNKMWDKTLGGNADDRQPWCVNQTLDGGYIIGAMSKSGISGDKTDSCRGNYDFWVIKLNSTGKIEWDKTIGGNGYDELRGIEEIKKNQFIITGISGSDKSGDKTAITRGEADYWIVYLND
ncbi:MAG: hypothetical protein ABI691_19900 [Ginsengibacter sp.]